MFAYSEVSAYNESQKSNKKKSVVLYKHYPRFSVAVCCRHIRKSLCGVSSLRVTYSLSMQVDYVVCS